MLKTMRCLLALLLIFVIKTTWAGGYEPKNSGMPEHLPFLPMDDNFDEDLLRYQDKIYLLCRQSPLTQYLQQSHSKALPSETHDASGRRGYVSFWVIEDGNLYLSFFDSPDSELRRQFRDLLSAYRRRWPATWFTGVITIPLEQQQFSPSERRTICDRHQSRYVMQLQFENGKLLSVSDQDFLGKGVLKQCPHIYDWFYRAAQHPHYRHGMVVEYLISNLCIFAPPAENPSQ